MRRRHHRLHAPAIAAGALVIGFRHDDRRGDRRRLRRLLRYRLLRQRDGQYLIDPLHRLDLEIALDVVRDLNEIFLILVRDEHGLMPPRCAASSFSFSPPIGSTSPRSVISPVMATSERTGILVSVETSAVHIPMPALGPSFGVAPSGMCRWMSCF